MHTPYYYILALLYADFSLVSSIRPIWLRTPNMAPYAQYGSIRPERAEAPSPGQHPG